jgi:hypothetical protein
LDGAVVGLEPALRLDDDDSFIPCWRDLKTRGFDD